MTDFGSARRRLRTQTLLNPSFLACVITLVVAAGGGCAKQTSSPGVGGSGGAVSTASTTHAASSSGTGGQGTGGGAGTGGVGGASASSSSSTSGAMSSSSGTGGVAGVGGAGGAGGAGGTGGAPFMPPLGSADYPAEHEPNNIKSMANPLPAGARGFTASIWPLGDVDMFEVTLTSPGSSLSAATSDGMGGCPLGAKTYVRISDDANNVLAEDSGAGGCVQLMPANYTSLLGLPVGKYYVHIESAALVTIPFYIVDIHAQAPFCGDGMVQVGAGEQCDHGSNNGSATDGCSATCQIKNGNYVNETEPNTTEATANNLDGTSGAVGQINPVGDQDWYSVDVTVPGSSITAEISDGFGGCPGAFDSLLSLYSPSMMLLVSDQQGGNLPCSKIDPHKYAQATNLLVGKYALEVQRLSPQTQPYYVLSVKVMPPACGDGILPEGNKQCDPPTPNPGCSATCQLTGDFIPETEPNDTQALANPLGTHAGFIAAIQPIGDLDYFSFNVPGPTSLVFLQVSDGVGGCPAGFTPVLHFYDPMGNVLAMDTNSGPGGCSLISPLTKPAAVNLPGGTYSARVELAGNNATQWEYVFTITVKQPVCGDGIIEAGEQCDDGPANGAPGDGCSATCQSLPPWEISPNSSMATATPPWPGYSTWKSHIVPLGDHDYFTFTLQAAGIVTLVTHDVDTPTVCNSDTVLHLLDHTGTQIASDDDSGPGPGEVGGGKCSLIAAQALAAGQYYAWVQHYSDKKTIPSYQLDLEVQ
jgi:cysteine-rich repeat protein